MDIALHIGANCTDEDKLLKSMLKNAGLLAQQNIRIPGPGRYRRLIRETIQNLNGAMPAPDTRQILLDAILDEDMPERLVLSNSNLIGAPPGVFQHGIFYSQAEKNLRGFQNLFSEDNLEIFLGMRDPATFLAACYKKAHADGKVQSFEQFMHGKPVDTVRWSDLVARIRHDLPATKLTVWCNEDTPVIWSQLILAVSGAKPDTPLKGCYDLVAAIMSQEGTSRLLAYLNDHPPKTEIRNRRVIEAFLAKYALDDEIEEVIDLPGLTADNIEDLSDIYDEDVALISRMTDVTFIS